MIKDAVISECLNYRYALSRKWDEKNDRTIVFCMLNPSTADASLDDPTIRRCIGFAKEWQYDQLVVINLYSLRTPNPKDLWPHPNPIGEDNDNCIQMMAKRYENIVCAWGANAKFDRVVQVAAILENSGANLMCLGTTKNGSPRHPLYIKSTQLLMPWNIKMLKK